MCWVADFAGACLVSWLCGAVDGVGVSQGLDLLLHAAAHNIGDLGREALYVRSTVSCAAGRAGFSLVAHGRSGCDPDLQQQGPDPAPLPPSSRSGNFYFAARHTEGDGWV